MIRRTFISMSITASFSGIVVLITLQGISLEGLIGVIGAILLIGLYATLAFVLFFVLYMEK